MTLVGKNKVKKQYRLLRDLPLYPAGTVVLREWDELPSRYNEGTYPTNMETYTNDGMKVMAPNFLDNIITWCAHPQREDLKGWVEEVIK